MNAWRQRLWDRDYAIEVDRLSIDNYGIAGLNLMEEAGKAVAEVVGRQCSGPILALAGPGNNGGDALVAAMHLASSGRDVTVVMPVATIDKLSPSCAHQYERASKAGLRIIPSVDSDLSENTTVIDGLLGLGYRGPLRAGAILDCLRSVAEKKPTLVVAIDLPSGLEANAITEQSVPLPAHTTITFGGLKPAHVIRPAANQSGDVLCKDIGFSSTACEDSKRLHAAEWEHVSADAILAQDPYTSLAPDANKYDRGHVLVIGGSAGKLGAPIMSALAALRAGAGWASIALPDSDSKNFLPPELTYEPFFAPGRIDTEQLFSYLTERKVRSLVIGPGCMESPLTSEVLEVLMKWDGFCVFDAGATRGLLDITKSHRLRIDRVLATPHPGEWQRLRAAPITIDKGKLVAQSAGITLVHKGATPMIFSNAVPLVTSAGDNQIAKAGSGDIIAGISAAYGAMGWSAAKAFSRAYCEYARTSSLFEKHKFIPSDYLQ